MNMLPPINVSSYDKHVKAIHAADKEAAKKSISSAAEAVNELYDPMEDDIYDSGILADWTWWRRGYSSSLARVSGILLLQARL